ncbi:unnamed protein product [Sphagnum troendelagicum]
MRRWTNVGQKLHECRMKVTRTWDGSRTDMGGKSDGRGQKLHECRMKVTWTWDGSRTDMGGKSDGRGMEIR